MAAEKENKTPVETKVRPNVTVSVTKQDQDGNTRWTCRITKEQRAEALKLMNLTDQAKRYFLVLKAEVLDEEWQSYETTNSSLTVYSKSMPIWSLFNPSTKQSIVLSPVLDPNT
jgi:hypothetical protein